MNMLLVGLCVLAGVTACSTATNRPSPAVLRNPSLEDFAGGDRDAVAAMLRDVAGKFRWPYAWIPTSRAATILLVCRVRAVHAGTDGSTGVVEVECLSAGSEIDLAIGDSTQFYYSPDFARREFAVSAGALAVGETRTCIVYGSGFGGELWKRFLIFPGPAR